MSILPRSQGSQVAYSTASYNVPYAAGIQAGDLMIVFASTSNLAGGSAGWTAGPTAVNPGNIRVQSFWKRAVGGESGSVAFSTASGTGTAYMTVLSGVVSTGVPYVNSSVGTGTGTAVSTGACPSVGSSDDGRYFRISAASYFTAQASAITAGAVSYTNVTGYSSSAFTATGTGTPTRSVVSWAGFFTGTTGTNSSAGTLTLPTSSAWAALSFDLLEQSSTSITNFSDPFASGYSSYWTASGSQVANTLVTSAAPGELAIGPSAAGAQGLWPSTLGAAKSFIGGRLQLRLRGSIRTGHVSTVSAGVSCYNGSSVSVTLGDGAGNSDVLAASIGGANVGQVSVNSQTGVWIRIDEAAGVATISYSGDGVTWNQLASASTGSFDARSAVPFIQVLPNSGADPSFAGVKWYAAWLNSSGANSLSPARVNLCNNPSAQVDALNMTGTITPTRDTSWPPNGQSFGCTPHTSSTDSYLAMSGLGSGGIRSGLKQGSTYICQGTVNVPVALSGPLSTRALGISFFHKSPSTGTSYVEISSGPAVLSAASTGYGLVTLQFTVPDDAAEAFVRIYNGATNSATNLVQWTGLILEETDTPGAYFDGDYPSCAWLGPAGSSPSICRSSRINQILDPGGEGSEAYNWYMGGGNGTVGTVSPSTDRARYGGKSLKVNWGTATTLPGLLTINQIKTIPGRQYLVRYSDFAAISQPGMVPVIANVGFPLALQSVPAPGSWHDYVGVFTATSMTHGPAFWPSFQPTGTEVTYIDGVGVEELTSLSVFDVVSGDSGTGGLWTGEPNYSESFTPAHGAQGDAQASALPAGQALAVGVGAVAVKALGNALVVDGSQVRVALSGGAAALANASATGSVAKAAAVSTSNRGVGLPAGALHSTSASALASGQVAGGAISSSISVLVGSLSGATVNTALLRGQGTVTGAAQATAIANPLSVGSLAGAVALTSGSATPVGIPGAGTHLLSSAITAISIFAPTAQAQGPVVGRGVVSTQSLASALASLTNAVLGQTQTASPNVEANSVSGAAVASGLVISGFHGYADGVAVVSTLAGIANAVAGSALGSSGAIARSYSAGLVASQGVPTGQAGVTGSAVGSALVQPGALVLVAAQLSAQLVSPARATGLGLTVSDVRASGVLQQFILAAAPSLARNALSGLAQNDGSAWTVPMVDGQRLASAELIAANFADGQSDSVGFAGGTHGDYFLWSDSELLPVELVGLWNGSSIDSVELVGLWNGEALIDQGVIPA